MVTPIEMVWQVAAKTERHNPLPEMVAREVEWTTYGWTLCGRQEYQ